MQPEEPLSAVGRLPSVGAALGDSPNWETSKAACRKQQEVVAEMGQACQPHGSVTQEERDLGP